MKARPTSFEFASGRSDARSGGVGVVVGGAPSAAPSPSSASARPSLPDWAAAGPGDLPAQEGGGGGSAASTAPARRSG